jgi:hypothetical protein
VKSRQPRRRQWLVLTAEETRTLCFVLIALVLGLATKQYRASHSTSPAKVGIHETAAAAGLPVSKRPAVKRDKMPK